MHCSGLFFQLFQYSYFSIPIKACYHVFTSQYTLKFQFYSEH